MKKVIIGAGIVVVILVAAILIASQKYIAQSDKKVQAVKQSAGLTDKVALISTGAEVDLKNYLVKDKVVIFDFYADWCGPCKMISPKLEELANQYSDVVVRKIDIINWSSPVAKQYQLSSIPNVRVYDKQGMPVGEPTYDYNVVLENVNTARAK